MVYPYETRFLQEDNTQITEEEYNTKLATDESVYLCMFCRLYLPLYSTWLTVTVYIQCITVYIRMYQIY